jgi:hypothetical protein
VLIDLGDTLGREFGIEEPETDDAEQVQGRWQQRR